MTEREQKKKAAPRRQKTSAEALREEFANMAKSAEALESEGGSPGIVTLGPVTMVETESLAVLKIGRRTEPAWRSVAKIVLAMVFFAVPGFVLIVLSYWDFGAPLEFIFGALLLVMGVYVIASSIQRIFRI